MKTLLDLHRPLRTLGSYIKSNSELIEKELQNHLMRKKAPRAPAMTVLTKEQLEFQEKHAVKTIIHAWRARKIKEAITKSPYLSYLSLLEPTEEQHLLSMLMFGQHVAELPITSNDRIDNPFIHTEARYHRIDDLSGELLNKLLIQFQIPVNKSYKYIPITRLRTTPVEQLLKQHLSDDYSTYQIHQSSEHSIILLAIHKLDVHLIEKALHAAGLAASPWEIAANIKTITGDKDIRKISMDPRLPQTKETLLQSTIIGKLNVIAGNSRYPTHKLAESLRRMLHNLPELNPRAIQRIALMLDMTNTFYEHNYPRYAFCVYAVVHEISLALLKQTDTATLDKDYNEFITESESTLLESLGLEKESLNNSRFIATPAMSGTNAYAIAMQLVSKMQTDKKPTIKVIEPAYYELDALTQLTEGSNPDIFTISCGPIVGIEGLTPGVDINLFVKHHIIDTKRTKPATIIIDATTTLYKNLTLAPEVKALVEQGKLSIIVHESHQKFGLLHTDQAQYGRMFGLCAKGSFTEDVLRDIQNNSKIDFNEHVDLRIGAYISKTCKEILEDIKKQHFRNGALLRNLLTQTSLVQKGIVRHKNMLTNLDELYFLTSFSERLHESTRGIAERDSFGHYASVKTAMGPEQTRISPDATDNVDCLIQAAQIYIAQHYSNKKLVTMIIEGSRDQKSLSLEYQIMSLAMLNQLVSSNYPLKNNINLIELFAAMDNILKNCPLLAGRQYFIKSYQYLMRAREFIKEKHHPLKPTSFFESIHILHNQNIKPMHLSSLNNPQLVNYMKASANLSELVYQAAAIITEIMPKNCAGFFPMLKNKDICTAIVLIYETQQQIFTQLKGSAKKYDAAIAHASYYLRDCLNALKTFSALNAPSEQNKTQLIQSLDAAKDKYCTVVLGKDRNKLSQAVRVMLMIATNFIASLTFGIAHYIYTKNTGRTLFFSKPETACKLHSTHKKLATELRKVTNEEKSELTTTIK